MPAADLMFQCTFFKNRKDNKPVFRGAEWSKVAAALTKHVIRSNKDGQLWSPATYRNGNTRCNDGVDYLFAAVGDYDHGPDFELVKDRFEPYEYVAHSSYRHTSAEPRYRVIIPFVKAVPAKDWPDIWQRVYEHIFGPESDKDTKDASRAYYMPSYPLDGEKFALHHEGELLDPYNLPLGKTPIPEKSNSSPVELPDQLAKVDLRKLPVPESIKALIRQGRDARPNKYESRSEAIFAVEEAMIKAGCDDATIASVLLDPNYIISEKGRERGIRWVAADIGRARTLAHEEEKTAAKPEPTVVPIETTVGQDPMTLAEVIAVFQKWLYLPDTGPLEMALAADIANHGKGEPVWLLLVGPPGSGKTEIVMSLTPDKDVRVIGKLTASSLLSGTPKRDKQHDAKGGLLHEIGAFGILVPKDFGSIIAMNKDSRAETLQMLREVYDGTATRDVGSDGGKRLEWSGKCGLIGASTAVIDQAHSVMSSLGERFIFYRTNCDNPAEMSRRAREHSHLSAEMRKELSDAVGRFLPTVVLPTTRYSLTKDEDNQITALAMITAQCRAPVEWDYQRHQIISAPGPEAPTRLGIVFELLFQSLIAIGCSKERAWELLGRVALDSLPLNRRNVIGILLEAEPSMKTTQIAEKLGLPTGNARQALESLEIYGVVKRYSREELHQRADEWELTEWTSVHLLLAGISFYPVLIYTNPKSLI